MNLNYWIVNRSWLRVHFVSAVLFSLLISALAGAVIAGALWWAGALGAISAAIVLFIPIGGHTVLPGWIKTVWSFLRRRKQPVSTPPAAVQVESISAACGVITDGFTLVAAIEVADEVDMTFEAGDKGQRALTSNVLSVKLVASWIHQYGLTFDIDILSDGQQVPSGTAYRTTYAQTVGARSLPAQRRTWIMLRLNTFDNLKSINRRGPVNSSARKALVSGAARVVQRLREHQFRAYALSQTQLDALAEQLNAPVAGRRTVEHWKTISNENMFTTTYVVDPDSLSDAQVDQWWSWRTEQTVTVIQLRAGDGDSVNVSALVRYVTLGAAEDPQNEALSVLGASQRDLLRATLPFGDQCKGNVVVPHTALEGLGDIRVPIGPAGQILGVGVEEHDGALVAASLADHSGNPQQRRIEARVSLMAAHQLVLRSIVTGSTVAIYTDEHSRWNSLVAAVGDPARLFFGAGGAKESDIAILDHKPMPVVPSRTIVKLDRENEFDDVGAVMRIEQQGDQPLITVRVRRRQLSGHRDRFQDPVTIRLFRDESENRFLGIVDTSGPQPRRQLSTEPVTSRAPRRPQPASAAVGGPQPPAAPRRRPAPEQQPVPAGAGRRDIKFAAPQRARRDPQAPAASAPPAAPRRRHHLPPPPGGQG
ncbi:type VII secretion protein EccE [Mycobacteroides abscessus]